ncbi:MAG TPA: ABC transporter permease subunit [Candidatus Methylomirabilis sp.]|nr:ABC transporter permease subunit [Candidatus Methylomirabilis sp.]
MRLFSILQSARAPLDLPNRWDIVVFPALFGLIFLLAWGTHQMAAPYSLGEPIQISLDPAALPQYAARTVLRMAVAMVLSLVFTLTYATLAAKYRRAEQVMVPLLDVLQSVPILGFLSITVLGFIRLFPGSLLGPEAAAIFAIFTSQAWNMAFSFYHSLRIIPRELYQVAAVFQLSSWQRFWKLEVPFALPNLLWNAMMSASGGWFFVVASEAISVAGHDILLPGIGSYIAVAIQQQDLTAIGYAIETMLLVVLVTDQLVFRPLVAWADRFKFEQASLGEAPTSWVLTLLTRTNLLRRLLVVPAWFWEWSVRQFRRLPAKPFLPRLRLRITRREARRLDRLWNWFLVVAAAVSIVVLTRFVVRETSYVEIGHVFLLGLLTALRVIVLILLASVVWVPIGVWIGLRPHLAQHLQPVALFLSAFPANLLFPLAVSLIVIHHLNPEIWLSPLMILGTQWYILFNVIAGAASIPADLREVSANLGLRRGAWWQRLILPGVFPAFVTGVITASGGAWNASVVSEIASWGIHTVSATGLGAYIALQTASGDYPRVALGIAVMSLYVVAVNRLVWRRLHLYAEKHLTLG